jgi:hypothetical protein
MQQKMRRPSSRSASTPKPIARPRMSPKLDLCAELVDVGIAVLDASAAVGVVDVVDDAEDAEDVEDVKELDEVDDGAVLLFSSESMLLPNVIA